MKRKVIIIGFAMAAFVLLCTATNPRTASSFVLVLPFIFLFIAMITAMQLLLEWRGWAATRTWQVSIFATGVPLGLLVLQSVGQLTIRDCATILAFFGVGYFYVARMLKRQS